ncbi:MAG: carbohydrate kinase family protein [Pseudomonadota bacterium]
MKVLTVGGAMVDTIAIIQSDRIERMTMRNADADFLLLEEGRKVEASQISTHVGGGAINAAVAMARQNHEVSALAKLGRDHRAELVSARLVEEGVGTAHLVYDDDQPTGASVLVASHERNAAIFTFRGANTCLASEDVAAADFGVDLVYVSSLSNNSADRFPQIVAAARETGAKVATNPGTRQLSARGNVFLDCLPDIDILCMNTAEASVLVPALVAKCGEGGAPLAVGAQTEGEAIPRLGQRGLSGGGFEMGLRRFMKGLRQFGAHTVLLTDGIDGAYLAHDDTIFFCPARKVDVVGTAGAGDAFASTLCASLGAAASPLTALPAAACNAASVVGAADTQTGLLTAEALATCVTAHADELPVRDFQL